DRVYHQFRRPLGGNGDGRRTAGGADPAARTPHRFRPDGRRHQRLIHTLGWSNIMELYLDTAHLDEVRTAARWGVLRGITTNPSHVAKAGVRELKAHIQEMCWIADVPISVEVVTVDATEMVAQGLDSAAWSPNVVVKI